MSRAADPTKEGPEGRPTVLALLRDIQSGATDPTAIPPETRLEMVAHLGSEGFSVPEIAEILRVNERTVKRDRSRARKSNALAPSPEFAGEMAGRLVHEAESSVVQIRRATRDSEATPADRIGGAQATWGVVRGLVESLQKMGILPTAPTHLRGELLHQVKHQVLEPDAMVQELDRIRRIAETLPESASEHLARIEAIRAEVRKVEITHQIKSLSTSLETKGESNEHDPDHRPV